MKVISRAKTRCGSYKRDLIFWRYPRWWEVKVSILELLPDQDRFQRCFDEEELASVSPKEFIQANEEYRG